VSTDLCKLLVEDCVVKRLTVAILVFNVFTPTVFAQTAPLPSAQTAQQGPRAGVLFGWLEVVRGAESRYKNKHGHYADLAALYNAHLLGSLVFESFVGNRKAEANSMPKTALFQVTVSKNGQHFKAVIGEHCGLNLVGEDMGAPRWQGILSDKGIFR